ncbi:MAG: enoyl-ACP reductase FabI [Proteobacteria bacterium]|uniref:enoyl-ACP reductase FabI n=1 Tax=Aquabacterium sp. TaxID=1872578 RepID=UPI0035C72EAC|nr:enoyl-ACP reductase FabI [Pseudomonadota bacterium]
MPNASVDAPADGRAPSGALPRASSHALPPSTLLAGKKALVVGVANEDSIATGCARAFRLCGADVALTYQNEKARPHVEPVAQAIGAEMLLPLDVTQPAQLDALFDTLATRWGQLDLLVHSIAFAPKADLQSGLLQSSAEGFAMAMDISCHSFLRLARRAVPLMREGGTLFAMSYLGANKVVPNYNLMGPVKAALEASCRYLAYELGPRGIRVHAISPGPIATRAASGLKEFDVLLAHAANEAPLQQAIDTMDVGLTCAHLASPLARHLTGATLYVDGGLNIMA